MTSRRVVLFSASLVLLAAAVIVLSDDFFSPYVSFAKAKAGPGSSVQVIGKRDRSVPVVHREGEFSFTLIDREGTAMAAVHRGPKPFNFEHADTIVLVGKYDPKREAFVADRVLVKCPSKYQKKKL